ncbi:MAG TPA: hypothetical protein VFW07_07310 [Parafilimonas sp.]|nr:hypothetical protein [Parafilimonas sp.]
MRNFFSISRKMLTVVITLAAIAGSALWYYFNYIPGNEEALIEQHFRWLQKIDGNIRAKIVAYDTLLSNLLDAHVSAPDKEKDHVENYISSYPNNALVAYKTPGDKEPRTYKKSNKADTIKTQFLLIWDSARNKLILSANKEQPDSNLKYNVSLTNDFETFIKPLLTPGLFEHYVVFYEGNYIYEDFYSGLGYKTKDEDSLLKTGKAMTGANLIDQKIGGIDYKIFFQPISFYSGKKLIVAGLLSQKQFNAQKKQLPPGLAVLTITIGIGLLLFLPWIKIYFQGKYDKVNLRDAAESVIVAKLLMTLIVSLFFIYNYPFRKDNEKHSKKVLANNIGAAFRKELETADSCLEKIDLFIFQDTMFYDIKNLGKKKALRLNENKGGTIQRENVFDTGNYVALDSTKNSIINNIFQNLDYYEINWLDSSNGRVKYSWTKSAQNNIHANYKDRSYFKNVLTNKTISLGKDSADPVALAQLISRTSGTFRTIISKKSRLDSISIKENNRAEVVAMSFAVKSLDSVIMPAGYSFAIIDNKGGVKYHSKPERNLNENLIEEFSTSDELKEALQGGFTEKFETRYYEGDYSVLIKPLQDLNYFVVIMSDLSIPAAVQIENFSFTWGMVLLFMIAVALDLFIIVVASSRRSLLKKQYFATGWLWPRADAGNEYGMAAVFNCFLIALMILIPLCHFHFFNYLFYLFLLFSCIPLSTIFINSLFLHKYKAEKNDVYQRYKTRCNRATVFFLVVVNFFGLMLMGLSAYWHVLLVEGFIGISGLLLFIFHKQKTTSRKNIIPFPKGYVNRYTLMVFTRLVLTSAIPVIFFLTASYNFENNLLARYRLYDFKKQLQQKFPGILLPDDAKLPKAVYNDSVWIYSYCNTKRDTGSDIKSDTGSNTKNDTALCNCPPPDKTLSKNEKNTARLFNAFGLYFGDISGVNNDNFYKTVSDDSTLYFNNFFDSALHTKKGNRLCVERNNRQIPASKKFFQVSSANVNYVFPRSMPYKGFVFWLLLLAAMLGFYCLLREVIIKICSLKLGQIPVFEENDGIVKELLGNKQQLIWIKGVPAEELVYKIRACAGKRIRCLNFDEIAFDDKKSKDIILKKLNEDEYTLDLKMGEAKKSGWSETKSDVINDQANLVIVQHIENNPDDLKTLAEKARCINYLLSNHKKVIIISGMHPVRMYEIINRKTEEVFTDPAITEMNALLTSAVVVVAPLIKNIYSDTDIAGDEKSDKALRLMLDQETKFTAYLRKLRRTLKDQLAVMSAQDFIEDRLTLRIQALAENYYMKIWKSLSSDEKFILYDLAADGLVNITNTFAVGQLMNKGLIIKEEGRMHIFNRSFRNFIVSTVDDKEIALLQQIHRKQSNWSNLQTPLILIVLAVFLFLAIAQEGIYSKVIGVITAVAGGIPTLLKLVSMFGVQANDKTGKKDA